jgi:hypothetical protein
MKRILIYSDLYDEKNNIAFSFHLADILEENIGISTFVIKSIGLSLPTDIIFFMEFGEIRRWSMSLPIEDQNIVNRMLVMSSHVKEIFYLRGSFNPIGIFWGDISFQNQIHEKFSRFSFIGESLCFSKIIDEVKYLVDGKKPFNTMLSGTLHAEDPIPFICDYLQAYIKAYDELHSVVEEEKYLFIDKENKPVIKYNFTFPGITPEKAKLMIQDKTTRINWLTDKLSNASQILSEESRVTINSLAKDGTSETINFDASKEDFQNWLNYISEKQTRLIILSLTGKKHESDFLCELVFELNDFLQNPSPEIPIVKYSVLSYPKEKAQQPPKDSFEKMIQSLELKEII